MSAPMIKVVFTKKSPYLYKLLENLFPNPKTKKYDTDTAVHKDTQI